jgi:hypothetical protein
MDTSEVVYYLPVLKHGPRSLTWMRMGIALKLIHKEKTKHYEKVERLLAIVSFNRRSKHVRTRKMVNYT